MLTSSSSKPDCFVLPACGCSVPGGTCQYAIDTAQACMQTYCAQSKLAAVLQVITLQAQAHVTVKGASEKADAAELADKEQTILELRETNEVRQCSAPSVIYNPGIGMLLYCA